VVKAGLKCCWKSLFAPSPKEDEKELDKLDVMVVDDEPLARARIRELLKRDADIGRIEECRDGFEAVQALQNEPPDLVFLDIQMPEKDGFEVIDEIGVERMPVVIFVTAYDQYALRAFQVCALDYLLKPFDERRFEQTLVRAKTQVRTAHGGRLHASLFSLMEQWHAHSKYVERVLVKTSGRFFFLNTSEIDWIKAEGNYVRLAVGKAAYLLRETVNNLERQLDPASFLRIHRSTIVNIDRIREIQQTFHGEYTVVLKDGTELRLSRRYREKLPRTVGKFS
jgi:two-component system, LytTR family, response regulator